MADAPAKACRCGGRVRRGVCDRCGPQRPQPEQRASSNARGYTYRWQQASEAYRTQHPLCEECVRQGRVTPASVVDHVVPHRGDAGRFWDQDNWEALCKTCHDRKTASGK